MKDPNHLIFRAMHISQVCNAIKNKLGLNKEAFLGHEAVVGSVINEPKAAYGEMSFYYMQVKCIILHLFGAAKSINCSKFVFKNVFNDFAVPNVMIFLIFLLGIFKQIQIVEN